MPSIAASIILVVVGLLGVIVADLVEDFAEKGEAVGADRRGLKRALGRCRRAPRRAANPRARKGRPLRHWTTLTSVRDIN